MNNECCGWSQVEILREINRLADRVISLLAYAGERHAEYVDKGGVAMRDGYGKI